MNIKPKTDILRVVRKIGHELMGNKILDETKYSYNYYLKLIPLLK